MSEPLLLDLICKSCGKDWKGVFPHGREEGNAECPKCHEMSGVEDTYEARYFALLFQVGNKHTSESRFMTAMRYIKNAERGDEGPCEVKR